MNIFTPNQENLTRDDQVKSVYEYCDNDGNPVFKTKEILKGKSNFVFYPYSVNPTNGVVSPKRLKTIELRGWGNIEDIPKDFKVNGRYGLTSQRIKLFFSFLYLKFKHFNKIVVGINIRNRFSTRTLSFNWADLDPILRNIANEKRWYDRTRKLLINNSLSKISSKLTRVCC